MKINLKNLGKLMFLGFLTFAITSCKKLPLQDRFEFDAEVPVLTPYKNLTALQFLELNPNGDFDYMLRAIKLTGMEAEFSLDIKDRTYLILKDTAFVDGYPNAAGANQYKGVFSDFGIPLADFLDDTKMDEPKRERFRKLLKYHIIGDKYIDQLSPLLPTRQVDVIFQSLIPGVEGTLSIKRSEFLGFNLNTSSTIPSGSGTNVTVAGKKKTTNRVQHGYVFKNGIGHLLSNYIRYVPF